MIATLIAQVESLKDAAPASGQALDSVINVPIMRPSWPSGS